jgi:hypothetical protein
LSTHLSEKLESGEPGFGGSMGPSRRGKCGMSGSAGRVVELQMDDHKRSLEEALDCRIAVGRFDQAALQKGDRPFVRNSGLVR